MSNKRTCKTKLVNKETLKQGLKNAGFEVAENKEVKLFTESQKADIAIKEPNSENYQLGFNKKGNEFEIFGDFHMYTPKNFKKLNSNRKVEEEVTNRIEALYQMQAAIDYASQLPGWEVTDHSDYNQIENTQQVYVELEQTA